MGRHDMSELKKLGSFVKNCYFCGHIFIPVLVGRELEISH